MDNKLREKFVEAVIKKLDAFESNIAIDQLLKAKGIEATERHLIIKAAEEKIAKRNIEKVNPSPTLDFPKDEVKTSPNSNYSSKVAPNDFSGFSKLPGNKSDEFELKNSSASVKTSSSSKIDEEFLSAVSHSHNLGSNITEHAPIHSLIINSFTTFIARIFKYLLLFVMNMALPALVFAIGTFFKSNLIVLISAIGFIFFAILFVISLAKFISEEGGFVSSIQYALSRFIPIVFTLFLIKLFIVSLFTIISLSTFPESFIGEGVAVVVEILAVIIIGIVFIWYSLVFWVMINEDEFYLYAITRSRSYLKNNISRYLIRIMIFAIMYVIVMALLGMLFDAILTFGMNIQFKANSIFSILKDSDMFLVKKFNPQTIKALLELKFLTFEYSDILLIPIISFVLFLLITWPMIFFQMLYHDFAKIGKHVVDKLSVKHQNLFFIPIILMPIMILYGSFFQGNANVEQAITKVNVDAKSFVEPHNSITGQNKENNISEDTDNLKSDKPKSPSVLIP